MASIITNYSCAQGSGFCFKQGDTLLMLAVKKDKTGVAEDITGWAIKCQGRDEDNNLIFSTETGNGITIVDAVNGVFQIQVDDTTTFPIGVLKADIEYHRNGVIFSTQTFTITVIEGITS